MEEKNELNDIILSKGGSNSNSKKLLLAIAALTLILIIVLVIMNSLKTQSEVQPPVAAVPPTPTSPKEIVDDPLFEPVKVIQEGEGNATGGTPSAAPVTPSAPQDLGKIAQKIKQESMQNTPAQEHVVQTAPATPAPQSVPAPQPKAVSVPSPAPVAAPAPTKVTAKPAVVSAPKAEKTVVNTPTIKTTKPTEVKKEAEPKKVAAKPATEASAPKTADKPAEKATAETKPAAAETSAPKTAAKSEDSGVWYIQVGSFSKEPNKALFDRLNSSGLKYTTVPAGATTKVMVGPFQGKKAAQDVLGNVKRNIESSAFPTPAQK